MKRLLFSGLLLSSSIAMAGWPACHTIVKQKTCDEIGQMLIVGFGGYKQNEQGKIVYNDPNGTIFKKSALVARYIRDDHIGGVILFSRFNYNFQTGKYFRPRNIQNPQQVANLNRKLQQYNTLTRKQQGLPMLPLMISVDQEGGHANRLPRWQGFHSARLTAQSFGAKESMAKTLAQKKAALKETYNYALAIGQELKSLHFNVDFAPVVDVNVNPTNPIIGGLGRSFSSNPKVVVDQAQQFIRGLHAQGILPVLKHFPGHGSSTADSHLGLVDVSDTYHKRQELYPYEKLIASGYQGMIMTTHVINGQLDQTQCRQGPKSDHQTWCPGTMSYKTLTNLLRHQLHFHGVIVSDDMTMKSIAAEYSLQEALANGINAGIDMFIISNNHQDETQRVLDTIAQLVKSGKVSQQKIHQAYANIIKMKKQLA